MVDPPGSMEIANLLNPKRLAHPEQLGMNSCKALSQSKTAKAIIPRHRPNFRFWLVPSGNQAWRAAKWTIEIDSIGDVPS